MFIFLLIECLYFGTKCLYFCIQMVFILPPKYVMHFYQLFIFLHSLKVGGVLNYIKKYIDYQLITKITSPLLKNIFSLLINYFF